MATKRIRLQQIEDGQTLKQMVLWFRSSRRQFPARLNALRARSRRAASRAGIGQKDIDRLVAEVRLRRAHSYTR